MLLRVCCGRAFALKSGSFRSQVQQTAVQVSFLLSSAGASFQWCFLPGVAQQALQAIGPVLDMRPLRRTFMSWHLPAVELLRSSMPDNLFIETYVWVM
ncbi:hypothetical protein WJX84_005341 [Apatococcus fuscideae]|uniref:Secreted protein n=1 Tax=Apatococcus fuscideae TaxID=2026836 RepID=A0AAW1SUA5_9CHLO